MLKCLPTLTLMSLTLLMSAEAHAGEKMLNKNFVVKLCLIGVVLGIAFFARKKSLTRRSTEVNAALDIIARKNPEWNRIKLESKVIDLFHETLNAWSNQDQEKLQKVLHPKLFPVWMRDLELQQAKLDKNEIRGILVLECRIVDVKNYLDDERDEFTVYFRATARETVSRRNKVVSETCDPFEEFWTFEWEQGEWKLREVTSSEEWQKFFYRKIISQKKPVALKKAA